MEAVQHTVHTGRLLDKPLHPRPCKHFYPFIGLPCNRLRRPVPGNRRSRRILGNSRWGTDACHCGIQFPGGYRSLCHLVTHPLDRCCINRLIHGCLHLLHRRDGHIYRIYDVHQDTGEIILQFNRRADASHPATFPSPETARPLFSSGRFFQFFFFFPVAFHLDLDSRYDKSLFLFLQAKEDRREDMQFQEGVISKISLPVALLDQFFASSTLSLNDTSKPWNFCTKAASSLYSPGSSTMANSSSSGSATP